MEREGRLIYRCTVPPGTEHGTYFAPHAFEIDSAARLTGEVFGPILHVVRWQPTVSTRSSTRSPRPATASPSASTAASTRPCAHPRAPPVGNIYVNRSMIGAVVGVQPFGGEGLSGTGPKAGGPRYLYRFATERTVSTDTTAAGGNATLLSLQEDG